MQMHGIQAYNLQHNTSVMVKKALFTTWRREQLSELILLHCQSWKVSTSLHARTQFFLGLKVNHPAWPPIYYRPKEKSFCKSRTTLSTFQVVYRWVGILTQLPKMTHGASRMKPQHSLMTLPPVQNHGLRSSLGATVKKTATSLNKTL